VNAFAQFTVAGALVSDGYLVMTYVLCHNITRSVFRYTTVAVHIKHASAHIDPSALFFYADRILDFNL